MRNLFVVAFGLALCSSGCAASGGGGGDRGDECSVDSDCNDPFVCALGKCHQPCIKMRDCPIGDRCVVAAPLAVCVLANEDRCAVGTCPNPLVCATDGHCRPKCANDSECLGSQTCTTWGPAAALVCVERSFPDAGSPPVDAGEPEAGSE